MNTIIKIGPASLHINIAPEANNLANFIGKFARSTENISDGIVDFIFSKKRKITLNKKKKTIVVAGPDIDNLNDPIVKIMVIQVLFRFANFVCIKSPYLLLHGSTSIFDGEKSIVFGDNGKNIGKTTSAIELALKSGSFVVDEFSFYDIEKNSVAAFDHLPIHLREFNLGYLNKKLKLNLNSKDNTLVDLSTLGLKQAGNNKLSMVVYPEFNNKKKPGFKKLTKNESIPALEVLAFSHIAKLINPNFDRMSWLGQRDSNEVYDLSETCHKLAASSKNLMQQILQKVSLYKITYNKPSQVVTLLNQITKQEKRSFVEHFSASAVVYFKKPEGLSILLLKKKNGKWVLPKGHIDEGEKPEDAAIREAKEEGGLKKGVAETMLAKDSYSWMPDFGFSEHKKTVLIYLVRGEEIKNKALECEGFEESVLVPVEEALKLASFDSEREAINKAYNILKKNG